MTNEITRYRRVTRLSEKAQEAADANDVEAWERLCDQYETARDAWLDGRSYSEAMTAVREAEAERRKTE